MDNKIKLTFEQAGQTIILEGDKSLLVDFGLLPKQAQTGLKPLETPTPSEIDLHIFVLYAPVEKALDGFIRDALKGGNFTTEGQVINALLMDAINRHAKK